MPVMAGRLDRPTLVVAAAVVLVVAAALIALGASPDPPALDPGSPEGIVQRYVQAVLNGDERAAVGYLAGPCEPAGAPELDEVRVTLRDVVVHDGTADVEVGITTVFGDPPLGRSEFTEEAVFDLVRSDERWLIEGVPWQVDVCPEPR